MFTGLVEGTGRVVAVGRRGPGARLAIVPDGPLEGLADGESIAVSGVCLTLSGVPPRGEALAFDVSPETLDRSTLGALRPGARVNLERALRADARLGGHFVAGHVDATLPLLDVSPEGDFWRVAFALPPQISRWVVEKGSIALDGVSLTIASLGSDRFDVAVIPATWDRTTLRERRPGDLVNAEADLLAKYVERLLAGRGPGTGSAAGEAQGTRDARLLGLLGGG